MKAINGLAIISLAMLFACTSRLDKAAYAAWVSDYDNGLHVRYEKADFIFDVQYQPQDYLRLQGREDLPEDGLQHILLSIQGKNSSQDVIRRGVTTDEEVRQRLYYFSYLFQNDIALQEGNRKTPCVLFHYEHPVDITKPHTFVLGFEKTGTTAMMCRLVIDTPYISDLPVKINISKANIPVLSL